MPSRPGALKAVEGAIALVTGASSDRHWPNPIPAEQVAAAVTRAVASDLPAVYVPNWLRIPAWLPGAAPRTFAAIAGRVS